MILIHGAGGHAAAMWPFAAPAAAKGFDVKVYHYVPNKDALLYALAERHPREASLALLVAAERLRASSHRCAKPSGSSSTP